MLMKGLHIISRQLVSLLILLSLLVLLAVAAVMVLSGQVEKHKDDIAAWASERLGYPLTLGNAGVQWQGLLPQLEVQHAMLLQKDNDTPIVSADKVYVSLDILASLRYAEPVIAQTIIDNAEISLNRDKQGQFHIVGIEEDAHQVSRTDITGVLHWLSWLKQVSLSDIRVDYTDQQHTELSGQYQLSQADVSFIKHDWRITANMLPPQQFGSEIHLQGAAEVDKQFQIETGQAQIQADNLVMDPLVTTWQGIQLSHGRGAVTAAINYQQDQTMTATLMLALKQVALDGLQAANEQDNPLLINELTGNLRYQQHNKQWQLAAEKLQLQVAGDTWPVTNFQLAHADDGLLTLHADYLRLSDLSHLALLWQEAPEIVRQMQPAGDLNALQLSYSPERGIQSLNFQVQDVSLLPWKKYPGVNGLSLDVAWHNNQASITMDSHNTTVFADDWLDEAVFFDSIKGGINWTKQDDDRWTFQANNLHVWNDDLNLTLNGALIQQSATSRQSNLQLQLQDVLVNRWQAYVPQTILPEDFNEWAQDAFMKGTIRSGVISLQGDPADFPFDQDDAKGQFVMALDVENVDLNYAEGWPVLTDVSGTVKGSGNNLLIESQSGKVAGFDFATVTTTIDDLVKDNPILRVNGLIKGRSAQALAFLQHSPLNSRFGSIADWIHIEGNSDIQLGLVVPLVDPDNTDVTGHVTFDGSSLTTQAVEGLKVSDIDGVLRFSNEGVEAENIQAVALAEPIKVDVNTYSDRTTVKVRGQASAPELRQLWPKFIPAMVTGKSAYTTDIDIAELQEGEFDVAVTVDSQLQGMMIDTPAPLGKTADSRMPFHLVIDSTGIGDELRYRISAGNWLNAALGVNGDAIRGQIVLGGAKAALSDQQFVVQGRLATLDLRPWLEWQTTHNTNMTVPTTAQTGGDLLPNNVDLYFAKLMLPGDIELTNLAFSAAQQGALWQVDLASPQVKGQVSVPQNLASEQPLDIQLDYLKLDLGENSDTLGSNIEMNSLWPSMQVDIEQLTLAGMNLGHLKLTGVKDITQWKLESAILESPVMQASASGNWIKTANKDYSQFDVNVSTKDMKALLGQYGYQQVMDAKQADLSGQFGWPGSPLSLTRDRVQGSMELSVGRGQLLDVEPGAAGRIFGLLSIAALPRRLTLDFSDLFMGGLDFSAITGKFNLAGGIARTSNLELNGDSARIVVSGSIDLVQRYYDQLVKVTPKVSSTLPIAGAVAGGPIGLGVGTAIMLVDKIADSVFERDIVNVITYSYRLQGPWDDPQVDISDAEKK